MNINFIRNLSDEILRENQQLKTEIITLRQRVADYEDQMTQAMTHYTPNPHLLASPRQTLSAFIAAFHALLQEREALIGTADERKGESQSLRMQVQLLEEECACLKTQVEVARRKEGELREEVRGADSRWEGEREELRKGNEQLSRELIQLKEQLRLERLMMSEAKRREVQEVRQYHLRELLDFREKADRQVVEVQRQLRAEVAERDNTIKHLEKALEKLSHNLKLDERESDIMVKLLRSFQQYNHLARTLQERSEELSRFRQQLQEMDVARIRVESRLKEVTANEANLHSQIDRLTIAKADLEYRLASHKQSLEKSEQDKEAMEKYYDHKWNKQYSKVKQQLERTFSDKIALVETSCQQKLQELEATTKQAQQQLAATLARNQELEEATRQKEQQRASSVQRTAQLERLLQELVRERREAERMTEQELTQRHYNHTQVVCCFENQINSLNRLISVEKEIYGDLQGQHQKELQELAQSHKQQLENLLSEKARERKVVEHEHEKEMRALQEELTQKERIIQDARATLLREMEEDFHQRHTAAQREAQARSREKEEELSRRNDKWMVKYKQIDIKYTQLKKRSEDDQETFKKEIARLETANQTLFSSERKLHAEVKESLVLKNDLLIRIGELEKRIALLNLQAEDAAEKRRDLQEALQEREEEIGRLKAARVSWLGELTEVQKSYKAEFEGLRQAHEKQMSLLKSKLWELEEVARKRPIKRRDYERLQQMEQERRKLRNEVYMKEAENIILNQVKDYYETKLREEERPPPEQSRAGTALMGYKLKMLKKSAQKQGLQLSELQQSKEVTEMRKYIVKSTKRSMKLSLSKIRSEDVSRYHRLNTAYE